MIIIFTGLEGVPESEEWLADNLSDGDKVGFDPVLMAVGRYLS